jgi:hypothetical protein
MKRREFIAFLARREAARLALSGVKLPYWGSS